MALGMNAQVGVGTATPNAQLDVRATNQATPSSTDGLLIPKVDAFPATNPGAQQQGMLVYLTTAAGPDAPGFYYWDFPTLDWIGLTAAAGSDRDWLETATALPPDNINDDIYHLGRTAIGKVAPIAPLDIEASGQNDVIRNTGNFDNVAGVDRAGIVNTVQGTTTDYLAGIRQHVYSEGMGNRYGVYNDVSGDGSGEQAGVFNFVTNTGDGSHYGTYNRISGGGFGNKFGSLSIMDATGSGELFGHYSLMSSQTNAPRFGTYNDMLTTGTAPGVGTFNYFRNSTTSTSNVGLYNLLEGTGDGEQTANANYIYNTGNGRHMATWNEVTGTGNGEHYGIRNIVSGAGNNWGMFSMVSSTGSGIQIGVASTMYGPGTGDKYGFHTVMDDAAGGTHYGVRSQALKPGSFAGYFQGNVAIGNNATNYYIMPPSRGLNGQIMVTDGAGNVTWQNPGLPTSDAWRITGNAGLASGTNFLGTTDDVSVAFRTGDIERMRLLNTGEFVVGNTVALPGDIFSAYAAGTNYAVSGYSGGGGAAGYFQNTSVGDALVSAKDGTSGSAGYFATMNTASTNSTVDIYNLTGAAPALTVYSSSTNAAADGIQVDMVSASAKRAIEVNVAAAVTGPGVIVFQNGSNRAGNFQAQHTTTVEPSLFASGASPNARVLNVQNSPTNSVNPVGWFSQASTGTLVATYGNAASVWGQSFGIRGGIFLAGSASANNTSLQGLYSGAAANVDAVGVFGRAQPNPAYGYGVVGTGNWYGVYANGNLGATGTKAFQIDHPLDPENKYLRHYALESPEVLNMYRGNVILDTNGEATVTLPDYFAAINKDFSYHLTAIGAQANAYIKEEINDQSQFKIAGGNPNQKISWQVIAERNDLYVQKNPESIAVEIEKREYDKGLYLRPELYNQPEDKGIFYRYQADPSKNKPAETLEPTPARHREPETKTRSTDPQP